MFFSCGSREKREDSGVGLAGLRVRELCWPGQLDEDLRGRRNSPEIDGSSETEITSGDSSANNETAITRKDHPVPQCRSSGTCEFNADLIAISPESIRWWPGLPE